jgi:hypothetical protein
MKKTTITLPFLSITMYNTIEKGSLLSLAQLPATAHEFVSDASGRRFNLYFDVAPGAEMAEKFDPEFILTKFTAAIGEAIKEGNFLEDMNGVATGWCEKSAAKLLSKLLRALQAKARGHTSHATFAVDDFADKTEIGSVCLASAHGRVKGDIYLGTVTVKEASGDSVHPLAAMLSSALGGGNNDDDDKIAVSFIYGANTMTAILDMPGPDTEEWFAPEVLANEVITALKASYEKVNHLFG